MSYLHKENVVFIKEYRHANSNAHLIVSDLCISRNSYQCLPWKLQKESFTGNFLTYLSIPTVIPLKVIISLLEYWSEVFAKLQEEFKRAAVFLKDESKIPVGNRRRARPSSHVALAFCISSRKHAKVHCVLINQNAEVTEKFTITTGKIP